MSSYTYLFTSSHADPNDAFRNQRLSLCSKYNMALFWFAFLDADASRSLVVVNPEDWEDFEDEFEVPDRPPEEFFLTLPVRDALALYDRRKALFFEAVPPNMEWVWAELRDVVARSGGRYLHFTPGDIAYMNGDGMPGWQRSFDVVLRALDSPPRIAGGGLFSMFRKAKFTPEWTMMAAMAGIDTSQIGTCPPWIFGGLSESLKMKMAWEPPNPV